MVHVNFCYRNSDLKKLQDINYLYTSFLNFFVEKTQNVMGIPFTLQVIKIRVFVSNFR